MKRINLLPPEIGERRRVSRQRAGLVFAGLAVIGLLVAVWVMRQAQLNTQKDRLADTQARVQTLEAKRNSLKEFADLEQTVITKEKTLASVMAGDVHWSRILTELSMVIPEESWLTNFTGAAGAPATGAATSAAAQASASLGTLNFTAVTFEFPDVAKWIIRLQGMKSLQNIWVPSAAKGELGSRTIVNFTSTADLSTSAASGRYQTSGAAR